MKRNTDASVLKEDESPSPQNIKLQLEIQELSRRLDWEKTYGRIFSVFSTVMLLVGFLWGLYQYNDTKKQEYKRRFWEKRLEIYSLITAAASQAAVIRDSSKRAEAFQTFAEAYHGPFVLIADDSSALAAKSFYNTFIDFKRDPSREADLQVSSRQFSLTARYRAFL